jgi:hypothetical protein
MLVDFRVEPNLSAQPEYDDPVDIQRDHRIRSNGINDTKSESQAKTPVPMAASAAPQ